MALNLMKKSLTRLRLINWHYFEDETIAFNGATLISGINASGKSTILDAVKMVLTVDTRHFNIAANENSKRDLMGYVRCKLGEDEIALDKAIADKLSLKVGDEVTLGLNNDKYLKQELKLKVSALIDSVYYNSFRNTMMINLDSYKRIYYDEPAYVLIDSNPEKTFEVIEMLRATLPDNSMRIVTNEEFLMEVRSSVESILTILYSIIGLGILLSLLGTSSNMLMGFEQSRRKYAIFYSSSMSKNKLKKLIVIEAALMIVLSVASASAFSLYFLNVIGKALTMINMTVVFVSPVLYSVIFGAIASLLMMIVVIKPVRMLSKMDVVKEIKTDSD